MVSVPSGCGGEPSVDDRPSRGWGGTVVPEGGDGQGGGGTSPPFKCTAFYVPTISAHFLSASFFLVVAGCRLCLAIVVEVVCGIRLLQRMEGPSLSTVVSYSTLWTQTWGFTTTTLWLEESFSSVPSLPWTFGASDGGPPSGGWCKGEGFCKGAEGGLGAEQHYQRAATHQTAQPAHVLWWGQRKRKKRFLV